MRVPIPRRQADGTFKIRLFYQDPTTGRRTSHIITFEGSKADAKRVAQQLALLRQTGVVHRLDNQTLAEMAIENLKGGAIVISPQSAQQHAANLQPFADRVQDWLASNRVQRLAAKTRESYSYLLLHYAVPALGHIPVGLLTSENLADWLNELAARKLSATTRRSALAVVAMALDSVSKDAGLPNVAREIRVKDHEPPRAAAMDVEQASAYLAALDSSNLDLALRTLLATGMRPGEVLGLKAADLHLGSEPPKIDVRRSVSRVKDDARQKNTKTGRQRSIEISPTLRDHLAEAVAADAASDWLFHDETGLPYWESTLRARHLAVLKAASLPHFRLYDLRHTHATIMLMAGGTPRGVSERLGHSAVSFTMQIYAHILPAKESAAVQKFDDLVGKDEKTDD